VRFSNCADDGVNASPAFTLDLGHSPFSVAKRSMMTEVPSQAMCNQRPLYGYNRDLISKSRSLERVGRIQIEHVEKNYIGPNRINPATAIVWRPA
jgi:hypothetical protein